MSHRQRRGQLTTVKANNSEKTKTVCNNSYIKTGPAEGENTLEQELNGRCTPNPHISRKYRVYVKYLDKLQVRVFHIYTKKKKSCKYMSGNELFLSLMEILLSTTDTLDT
jgi:predicted glycosyltransferase involved in capsule biosynthesis